MNDDQPCSNDNPDADYSTYGLNSAVPCHSASDYEAMFDDDDDAAATTIETASIDDFDDGSTPMEETTSKYPSFYSSCVGVTSSSQGELGSDDASLNSNSNTVALTLRFGYEVYTPTQVQQREEKTSNDEEVDLQAILVEFEQRLAKGVATSLGLMDCNDVVDTGAIPPPPLMEEGKVEFVVFDVARTTTTNGVLTFPEATYPLHRRYYMRRRRILLRSSQVAQPNWRRVTTMVHGGGPSVVGLSSDPVDVVETEKSSCRTSISLDEPADCTPIFGTMTARITGPRTADFKPSTVYNAIRDYIQNEQDEYTDVDNLLHVAYTGPKGAEQVVKPTTTTEIKVGMPQNGNAAEAGSRSRSIGIVCATTASLVVFFIVTLLVALRQKRRSQSRQTDTTNLDEEGAYPVMESLPKDYGDTRQSLILVPTTCARNNDNEDSTNEEEEGPSHHDLDGNVNIVSPYTPLSTRGEEDDVDDNDDDDNVAPMLDGDTLLSSNSCMDTRAPIFHEPMPAWEEEEEEDEGVTIDGVRGRMSDGNSDDDSYFAGEV